MAALLSQHQFAQALQKMCGISLEATKDLLPLYDEAARTANIALPHLPKLGLFSSQDERVAAFISICLLLDEQVERGEITRDGTQVALMLMMVSDTGFYKATKAFAIYAYPFRNKAMTTDSDTVDRWFRSMANQ